MQGPNSQKQQKDANEKIVQIRHKLESLLESQLQEIQALLQEAEGARSKGYSLGNLRQSHQKRKDYQKRKDGHPQIRLI